MTSRDEALRALEKEVREYGRVSDRAGMTGVAEDFRDVADRLQAILATASEQAPVACERCGRTAIHYLVCTNIPNPRRQPFCESCSTDHENTAREINDHEMRNFGGAYGLVTWSYEPLESSPAHTSEERDAARYRWMRRGLANTKLLPDGVADLFANALDQNDATKFDAAIDAAMRQEAE